MLKIQDLDYTVLFAALSQANLVQLILVQPQRLHADEDTIRVCLKFVISLMFK